MNRLILIGNGFDLSHGMKTSYKDFIQYLLKEKYKLFYENRGDNMVFELFELECISDNDYTYKDPESIKCFIEFFSNHKKPNHYFIFRPNILCNKIFNDLCNQDWVDIELSYFNALSSIIGDNNNLNEGKTSEISKLNKELVILTDELVKYLSSQQKGKEIVVNHTYINIFSMSIKEEDIRWKFPLQESLMNKAKGSSEHRQVVKTMFLNFNYTNTLIPYIKYLFKVSDERYDDNLENCDTFLPNHIHGSLEENDNPPIFGFGDEYNKKYQEFEEINSESIFEHIKSYRYLLTDRYKKLQAFMDEDYYQVFIVGHSCGLSDRTLLKSIFENDKCLSIKLFHQNDSNNGKIKYKQKAIQVGRHISDKQYMRKVIASYDIENIIPNI